MTEFMLLIFNEGEHADRMSAEEEQKFLAQCRDYIDELKKVGQLIAAQPLKREGILLRKKIDGWEEASFRKAGQIQIGYYHILANDLDEAVRIAKRNPEFLYGNTASVEIRPIKTKEKTTGYTYPK